MSRFRALFTRAFASASVSVRVAVGVSVISLAEVKTTFCVPLGYVMFIVASVGCVTISFSVPSISVTVLAICVLVSFVCLRTLVVGDAIHCCVRVTSAEIGMFVSDCTGAVATPSAIGPFMIAFRIR